MMKNIFAICTLLAMMTFVVSCARGQSATKSDRSNLKNTKQSTKLAKATLGAGCFWCVEAIFQHLKGVKKVVAGYAGGHVKNPTYRQVATGTTGHAEVARIIFNPDVISYKTLLTVFWHTHNPTTLNRQGPDVGPQYRSVIFYHNKKQKRIAFKSRRKVEHSDLWEDPIVTDIAPIHNYYRAEDYHQNYYKNHPNGAYCSVIIAPKIAKLKKNFPNLLKEKYD